MPAMVVSSTMMPSGPAPSTKPTESVAVSYPDHAPDP
jgi:hypothetical protein